MNKVLIENAVPLNNGDAALIFALGESLENKGMDVTYSTFNFQEVIKKYPEKKWIESPLSNKYITKLPVIKSLYWKLILRKGEAFDAVIGAPGGYINSYYGFKNKLKLMDLYQKMFGSKTFMFSQSIGPLNKKDSSILNNYISRFALFYVRDDVSFSRMVELADGNERENVIQTYDAAFLLPTLPQKENSQSSPRKIAVSVRGWGFDDRDTEKYNSIIMNLVRMGMKKGYNITFLSTCQGNNNYVNDSEKAKEIYRLFTSEEQSRIEVDEKDYTLDELRSELRNYDFVVGTRLHMCILSWLSNVPAFNISYEEKGREVYKYLGLSQYTIDYNESDDYISDFSSFLNMNSKDISLVMNKIGDIRSEMQKAIDLVIDQIAKDK